VSRWCAGLLAASLVVVLGGCRLDVVADAELDRHGAGRAALVFTLDPALLAELDALGVDPTAELAAAGPAPGWSVTRSAPPDGGLTIRLERDVVDAAGIGDAYRELVAGLGADDPALLADLDVTRDAEGRSRVTGTLGFRPPATAGATLDGVPLGPSGERLAELTRTSVRPRLELTLPGAIVAHDGDGVAGRTITWVAPVGGERPVTATATAPAWYTHPWVVAAGTGLLVVAVVGAGLAVWRRRRSPRPRRDPVSPAG
jgi:hypothetical protein